MVKPAETVNLDVLQGLNTQLGEISSFGPKKPLANSAESMSAFLSTEPDRLFPILGKIIRAHLLRDRDWTSVFAARTVIGIKQNELLRLRIKILLGLRIVRLAPSVEQQQHQQDGLAQNSETRTEDGCEGNDG